MMCEIQDTKPTITIVTDRQQKLWITESERLQRIDDARLARQRYREMIADPTQIVTEKQYQQMLQEAGLEE